MSHKSLSKFQYPPQRPPRPRSPRAVSLPGARAPPPAQPVCGGPLPACRRGGARRAGEPPAVLPVPVGASLPRSCAPRWGGCTPRAAPSPSLRGGAARRRARVPELRRRIFCVSESQVGGRVFWVRESQVAGRGAAGRQGSGAVGPEACGAAGPESPLAEREPRRAWRAGRVGQGTPASPQRRARCAASGGPERRRRPQKVKGQGPVFCVSKSGGRARLLGWRESGGQARGGGAAARRRGGPEARGRKRLPLPGTPAEPGGRGPRARAFTFCGLLLRSGRRPRLLRQRESEPFQFDVARFVHFRFYCLCSWDHVKICGPVQSQHFTFVFLQ
ncbi:uncharacterized protein ACH125_004678 [Urocitellus parryii]